MVEAGLCSVWTAAAESVVVGAASESDALRWITISITGSTGVAVSAIGCGA